MLWGINLADSLEIPIALTASEAGYNLYAKNGFVDLPEEGKWWESDLEKWSRKIGEREKEFLRDKRAGEETKGPSLHERMKGLREKEWCMVRWPWKEN